jgi:isopentenyldiphosphate isomerase
VADYPPLQIFNEDDQPIGEASLQEILAKGLLHRVIHIIIEDPAGNVLLQKRGPNVATNPNTWDFSVGGYVDAHESYDAAAERELTEELGLRGFPLQKLGVERESENVNSSQINRFAALYKLVIPANTSLAINSDEVLEIKWYDEPALRKLVTSGPKYISPYFAAWLSRQYLEP